MTSGEGRAIGATTRISALPLYPIVVAAAYVVNLWVESGVSVFAATRALLVAIVVTCVLLAALVAIIRDRHAAGFLALAAVAVLISRGIADLAAVGILTLAIPAALALGARIRRRRLAPASATAALNVFSGVLLVVILAGAVPRGTLAALIDDVAHQGASLSNRPAREAATSEYPDILILLLDGYPRSDALERRFGADNAGFIGALERRGFDVAAESQSNYPYTQATLSSMLHMRPLHELPALAPVETGEVDDYPFLRLHLNDNPVFEIARERGYVVVTSSPGYEHVTLRHADVFLDDGSLNEFERQLIRATTVQSIVDAVAPEALADQHRSRIVSGFDYYEELSASRGDPILAIVHVPSPHLPVVLDTSGALLVDPPALDAFRDRPLGERAITAYLEQLNYLNARTLTAVDRALEEYRARGADPLLVVMSDHGAEPPALPGQPWTAEHYASFFAIRWPAAVGAAVPADVSPVNLFPTIYNELFKLDLVTWPDQRYQWGDAPSISEGMP